MLARALRRLLEGSRPPRTVARRWRPVRGAVPALALAVMLAACAPALSAAPASSTVEGNDAQVTVGSSSDGAASSTTADGTPASAATPDGVLADAAPATSDPPSRTPADPPADPPAAATAAAAQVQEGLASWYGPKFAGRLTSDGEVFDPGKLTAAHRTLPFGTLVRVTNLANGQSVVVRINDRGPFKPNRIIDLSEAAAKAIGMFRTGVSRVRLEPLALPDGVVRVGVDDQLHGYQVLSRFHKVGQLLVLSKRDGAHPLVVRVVGSAVPPASGADVLVAADVYALIGSQAHVQDR